MRLQFLALTLLLASVAARVVRGRDAGKLVARSALDWGVAPAGARAYGEAPLRVYDEAPARVYDEALLGPRFSYAVTAADLEASFSPLSLISDVTLGNALSGIAILINMKSASIRAESAAKKKVVEDSIKVLQKELEA